MTARLLKEKDTHFLVDFGDDKPVVIAKVGLSDATTRKIKGYAEGGEIKTVKYPPPEEETPAEAALREAADLRRAQLTAAQAVGLGIPEIKGADSAVAEYEADKAASAVRDEPAPGFGGFQTREGQLQHQLIEGGAEEYPWSVTPSATLEPKKAPEEEPTPRIELTPEQIALAQFDATFGQPAKARQLGLPEDAPVLDTYDYEKATAQERGAIEARGRIEAEHKAKEAELLRDQQDLERAAFEADRVFRRAILDEQREMYEKAQKDEIDPNRYMKSLGSDGQTQAAFAVLVSGLGQGMVMALTGRDPGNLAQQMIEKNIDRDIDAQLQNRAQRNAMLENFRRLGLSEIEGREWERATRTAIAAGDLVRLGAEYGSKEVFAKAQEAASRLLAVSEAAKLDIAQRNIGNWRQAEDAKLRAREFNLRAQTEADQQNLARMGMRSKLVAGIAAASDDEINRKFVTGYALTREDLARLNKDNNLAAAALNSIKMNGEPIYVYAKDKDTAQEVSKADAQFLRTVNDLRELIKFSENNPNLPNRFTDSTDLGKAQQQHFNAFWTGLSQYAKTMGKITNTEMESALKGMLPDPAEWKLYGSDQRLSMYRNFLDSYIKAHRESINATTRGGWGDQIEIPPEKSAPKAKE